MRITLIIAFLIGSIGTSFGQLYTDNENFKVGVGFGMNVSTLTGTELINPQFNKRGMTIGVYYRQQLSKNLDARVEFRGTFKGSNFRVDRDLEYNKMDLIYLDIPTTLMVDVTKDGKNQVFFGGQPSFLLNSRVFVQPNPKAEFLKEQIDLKTFDFAAVAGYQFNHKYYGIQASLKYGLVDINNNLNLEGVLQPTGTGGTIRNIAVELAILF